MMIRKRLAKYSIPEPILAAWEKRFGQRLLPLQARAVDEYRLLDGESLLISAPTSSGKTFCGEMALIRAVQSRRKGIYLAPLKAVAEEKYRQFQESYGTAGLTVTIATRDHPENDSVVQRGRFDIAVMVYEKFSALLIANIDLLAQVGALVVDELQMLEDEERGAGLELALTKLLSCAYQPQIIALSAVVGEASGLAAWLGCRLLVEKNRPVDLRRGVAVGGVFHYRSHNTGEIGSEECREEEETSATLFENIKAEISAGRQALVFLKSRHETITAAEQFAEHAKREFSQENRQWFDVRLEDEEESSLRDTLDRVLPYGVAFHNADLTASQRTAIEDGYRQKRLAVIFATTTIATGINLPASTVFIEAQKYRQQEHTGRPAMEPLSWAEYESMSGRAGRVGLGGAHPEVGRAILFAGSELEKSILWDYYVESHPTALKSRLAAMPSAGLLIDLFSSDLAHSPEDFSRIIAQSYGASTLLSPFGPALYAALIEDGFLVREGDVLVATPLARETAASGLTVATVRYLIRNQGVLQAGDDEQILYHLLQSPDGRRVYLPYGGEGRYQRGRASVPRMSEEESPLVRELLSQRRELMPDEISRLRLTVLLCRWMEGTPALEIEQEFNLYLGMIDSLARQCGWLISSSAAVLGAQDRLSAAPARLARLAFSVARGLPAEMQSLYSRLGQFLRRSELLALHREGITTCDELAHDGRARLRAIVHSGDRLSRIEQHLDQLEDNSMWSNVRMDGIRIAPQSIEIEGVPVQERFLVRINGRPIQLTGKSFKYLLRLAWSRMTKDNGWLYKEDLEQGFNQARYLYRLRQEIGRDFLPEWPLYENNRAGYYRLAAEREKIRINVAALKENPDYEIRQMAADLNPLFAS